MPRSIIISGAMTATPPSATAPDSPAGASSRANRVTSIDALRGLVMFTMILVNDIAGGQDIPAWIRHYNDGRAGSGMTFVDLVFPAFLFIVGMSIPFAMGARLARREPIWKTLGHVLLRTVSLLAIGIMMVNAESGPPNGRTPLSRNAWSALLYIAAILSFCSLAPRRGAADASRKRRLVILSAVLRVIGIAILLWLALIYRTDRGHHLLAFHAAWPFIKIRTEWYGILGLIGWAYLVGSIAYLCFRTNRLPLLACIALLLCLFAADQKGAFNHFALNNIVSIGTALGSQASITVAGVLLASILLTPDTAGHARRIRFTALYIVGFAAAALLAEPLYGIIKNEATPSWCLWACAVTAGAWLLFYLVTDVLRMPWLLKPLTIAGENVLLAYLLSQGLEYWLTLMRLGEKYENLAKDFPAALARSTGCAVIILIITALLNRAGFRLKL
jgi:predicted acyltransferase